MYICLASVFALKQIVIFDVDKQLKLGLIFVTTIVKDFPKILFQNYQL